MAIYSHHRLHFGKFTTFMHHCPIAALHKFHLCIAYFFIVMYNKKVNV